MVPVLKWILTNTTHFSLSGPVHTETFSCVFVLFQVMSWLFSITLENSKQYKNAGKLSRVFGASVSLFTERGGNC